MTPIADAEISTKEHSILDTAKLAAQIEADRQERAARTGETTPECVACGRATLNPDGFYQQRCRDWIARGESTAKERERFDPFNYASLRHVAGPDPGYLPRGMRSGPGFFIRCLNCEMEFESKGLRCCSPDCEKALQCVEDLSGRRCSPPNLETLHDRPAASETLINQGSDFAKIGPSDRPSVFEGRGIRGPVSVIESEVFPGRSKRMGSDVEGRAYRWRRK